MRHAYSAGLGWPGLVWWADITWRYLPSGSGGRHPLGKAVEYSCVPFTVGVEGDPQHVVVRVDSCGIQVRLRGVELGVALAGVPVTL